MEFPIIQQPASNNPWDKDVPLITDKYHTDAYITDTIEAPSMYNELCHKLRTASTFDTFTLHINTPGGMLDSAFMITDAIKRSQAKVTASLTGTVASAGTLITLACDDVYIAPHTSFMIHNYSAVIGGKGGEIKSRQEHTDKALTNAFGEFYSGFLTQKEIKEVIDGKDMWMGTDEVLNRLANKQALDIIPRITSSSDEEPITVGRKKSTKKV